MLSIIIPVHREPYLDKTINSLLESCITDVEIIIVFDGLVEKISVKKDPRIKIVVIKRGGFRKAINAGIVKSRGDYIMKCDSHCLFAKGFDKILIDSCKENWLIIPSRYSLHENTWKIDKTRPRRDYHYLAFPDLKNYNGGLVVVDWCCKEKRNNIMIDDTMTFQGSCWLANKKYFMEHIGLLDDSPNTYGTFIQEYLEIGMKYWLKGGAIKVNKKTWYAHLSKRGFHYKKRIFSRKFKKDDQAIKSYSWVAKHWINNKEPHTIKTFDWFIKKFLPIPTWDINWQNKWDKLNQ